MMTRIVKVDATAHHGTALLASDDSVWLTVALRWWDVATRTWWWLMPSDRKAWVVLTNVHGERVRTRAVRIANKYVRIRTTPLTLAERS